MQARHPIGCRGRDGGCFAISAKKAAIVRAKEPGLGVRPGEGDRDSAGDVGDGSDVLGAGGSSLPRLLGTGTIASCEVEASTSSNVTGATGMETFGLTPWIESI